MDQQRQAEDPYVPCPACGAQVPEHWRAMGVCPACNSSLAPPTAQEAAPPVPAPPLELPTPDQEPSQPPETAPPIPQMEIPPTPIAAAEDDSGADDARRELIEVLEDVEQQKESAAPAALPAPPIAPPPVPAVAEPVEAAPEKSRKGLIGILVAIGVVLFKAKGFILILLGKLKFLLPALKFLKLGKLLTTGGSMLLWAVLYATIFGWPYAVGFVLLILVHEMGHMLVIWKSGLPTSAPIFIPFMGAVIFMKEMPRNVKLEAAIAFGGPILGTVGALVCYGVYLLTGSGLWLALAYVGCFINLFNLLPVLPLDGGRIMAAVSPKVWLIGMVLLVVLFLKIHSIILLLLVLLSLPRTIKALRHKHTEEEARYYDVSPGMRGLIAFGYFGLAAFLGYMMLYAFETLGPVG